MRSKKEIAKILKNLKPPSKKFINKLIPFLEGLYRYYFRCEVHGLENIPKKKALFVGNHNGLLTWEVLMLFYMWWKRYGNKRKAIGLAHNIALENPFFKWVIPQLGAVPADPEVAYGAIRKGYSLLVYPGGEKEAFRPFKNRDKVEFYHRKGFIRLALRAKVPIVPIVSVGAQETYLILNRGDLLVEKLGLKKKYRLHGLPLTVRGVFFMWLVATGMLTFFPLLLAPWVFLSIFIPLPAKMKFFILPSIDPQALWDKHLSEEENLEKIYQFVVSTMQEVMTREYGKRNFPIIG